MEVVDFFPLSFQDIPEQDNPAFGETECLMIVRESKLSSDHAVVLHIVPNPIEEVTSVAKFWCHDRAVEYCKTFEKSDQLRPQISTKRKTSFGIITVSFTLKEGAIYNAMDHKELDIVDAGLYLAEKKVLELGGELLDWTDD